MPCANGRCPSAALFTPRRCPPAPPTAVFLPSSRTRTPAFPAHETTGITPPPPMANVSFLSEPLSLPAPETTVSPPSSPSTAATTPFSRSSSHQPRSCPLVSPVEVAAPPLFACPKCNLRSYCSVSCQTEHWDAFHKEQCWQLREAVKLPQEAESLYQMGWPGWAVGLCGEGVPALSRSSGENEKVEGKDGTEEAETNTKKSKNKRKRRAGGAVVGGNYEVAGGGELWPDGLWSDVCLESESGAFCLHAFQQKLKSFRRTVVGLGATVIVAKKKERENRERVELENFAKKKRDELENFAKKKGKKARKAALALVAEREKDRAAEEKKGVDGRAKKERPQGDTLRAESRRPDGPAFVYVMVRPDDQGGDVPPLRTYVVRINMLAAVWERNSLTGCNELWGGVDVKELGDRMQEVAGGCSDSGTLVLQGGSADGGEVLPIAVHKVELRPADHRPQPVEVLNTATRCMLRLGFRPRDIVLGFQSVADLMDSHVYENLFGEIDVRPNLRGDRRIEESSTAAAILMALDFQAEDPATSAFFRNLFGWDGEKIGVWGADSVREYIAE